MLINVKMPTIVGILTFMSRINFMLSLVEHEKSFITSGLILLLANNKGAYQPAHLHSLISTFLFALWSVCLLKVQLAKFNILASLCSRAG